MLCILARRFRGGMRLVALTGKVALSRYFDYTRQSAAVGAGPLLSVGVSAPDFTLPTDEGTSLQLSEVMRREHVVLYFYPKDFTIGCIKEACEFRDNYPSLQAEGAALIGVSTDDAGSHIRFKAKYVLPFPLVADTAHTAIRLYDVRRGFLLPGAQRVTYVIERGGVIRGAFRHELAIGHHQDDVLLTLREINAHAREAS